ncbi:MAG: UbiH/UbiF/VisC/COQ6 family ubiquinone biosynthesis hydroxylase [Gammaproteobacteria bacterium]|nr:UbiH/UbiF/VisC/COQ6 family ubiquinone biosynthesis hydroxylase [Gammaproteobacteria bacterium]
MSAQAANRTRHYDLVIVGGGMVGTALACALQDCRLSVALIEAHEPNDNWPDNEYDLRVSAITHGSQRFLETLGVWQDIIGQRACAYHEMQVWDAGGGGSIHFDCAEIGEPNLGHIVENRILNRALMQQARGIDHLDIYCPATPSQLSLDAHCAKLQLADGSALSAELLVGADGGQSWVRQQAGIAVSSRDYQQTAIVATVRTERSHQHTAWQRFLPSGPLAFLPLGFLPPGSDADDHHLSSIVWSTSPAEAERLCQLDEADFNAELTAAFEARLGAVLGSGPRASFAIRGQHASHYVRPHLALIGDAAHTIHPLAGQGVNLGFADARCLADILLTTHAAQQAIGSLKPLRRYERSRRGDNAVMLEAMGVFKQLFSNNTPLLRELRNSGLNLTDRLTPLKRLLMSRALG